MLDPRHLLLSPSLLPEAIGRDDGAIQPFVEVPVGRVIENLARLVEVPDGRLIEQLASFQVDLTTGKEYEVLAFGRVPLVPTAHTIMLLKDAASKQQFIDHFSNLSWQIQHVRLAA